MLAGIWRSARQGASVTSARILKRVCEWISRSLSRVLTPILGLVALETNAVCTGQSMLKVFSLWLKSLAVIHAIALGLCTHRKIVLFRADRLQIWLLRNIISS